MKLFCFLILLLGIGFIAPQGISLGADKDLIVMGFNPAENADAIMSKGGKLSDYFKKKLGIGVKVFVATDYTALVEALRSGQVDFAWLPAFSYIKAEEIAHAKIQLKCVRKGHALLYGAIITRADRPYSKIEDLKGKNIAWVDPSSSTGHIVPKAELIRKKNIDPDTFFGRQLFAGSHDAVVLSVINGTVDAGATYADDDKAVDGSWTRYFKGEFQKKIKVIYLTEGIPGDTVTASAQFAEGHKELLGKITQTLVDMSKNPEGKEILFSLNQVDSLIPAKPSDYQSLRDAAKILHIE